VAMAHGNGHNLESVREPRTDADSLPCVKQVRGNPILAPMPSFPNRKAPASCPLSQHSPARPRPCNMPSSGYKRENTNVLVGLQRMDRILAGKFVRSLSGDRGEMDVLSSRAILGRSRRAYIFVHHLLLPPPLLLLGMYPKYVSHLSPSFVHKHIFSYVCLSFQQCLLSSCLPIKNQWQNQTSKLAYIEMPLLGLHQDL
jgi:hypothetical protein